MLPFVLKRLIQAIPTFLLATILLFFVVQAAPGDFLDQIKHTPNIKPETVARLTRDFGLDQPVYVQYWKWLTNFVQGNLGDSFEYRRPVWEIVAPKMWDSLILVVLSTTVLYMVAIPVGVLGALKPYSFWDKVFSLLSYVGLGIPSFFFGLLAIFALVTIKQNTGWDIPIVGKSSSQLQDPTPLRYAWDVFLHALVPSIILVLREISSESRIIRGQMLEILGLDYVRTARAKGLPNNSVVYKHAFRNALIPQIANIGGLLPGILGGAGFIEVVFNWPGLTPLLLNALNNQDLYIIVSTTSLTVLLYIIGNLIGDLLLGAVDPRIRYH